MKTIIGIMIMTIVATNHANVNEYHRIFINFYFTQVPPGNNVDSEYKLRVEGAGISE